MTRSTPVLRRRFVLRPWVLRSWIAALLLWSGGALAADEDVTDLRLSREAGDLIRLEWVAPVAPGDSYIVRRCPLSTVALSRGTCIAEDYPNEWYLDPPRDGSYFYLVSSSTAGVEGPLGDGFDGTSAVPRVAPACGDGPPGTPIVVTISVTEPGEFCGSLVAIEFVPGTVEFGMGECGVILRDWFGFADVLEGTVGYLCGTAEDTGESGPGPITVITLERGECPVPVNEILLTECTFSECLTGREFALDCTISVQE